MRTDQSRLRRPGVAAAVGAIAVAGVVGGVSVAGAREVRTIYSVENDGQTCAPSDRPLTLAVQTGDTVKWDMTSAPTHNAASNGTANASAAAAAAWQGRVTPFPQSGDEFTFGEAGEYKFRCLAHTGMEGTVVVTGEPVATATPSVTQTATPTTTASATPTFVATPPPGATPVPDDHTNTPAPGKIARQDKQAPQLTRARVKAVAAGARLSFTLSEPATIQVSARRGKRTVTAATLHAPAGARTLTIRSASLRRKGTYTLQWQAVDAMANKSAVVKKTLKVKG
jgi:plastocyanin/methionine-rich copper-binding protein CopC